MVETNLDVVIYCDGACRGNPGPGGWGAVLECKGVKKELHGYSPKATNNQMELTAAIRSLKALIKPCNATVYTDSNYVVKGITEWIRGWKKNKWKSSTGGDVKNMELWKELDEVCQKHNVKWQWVRGHSGVPGNERADMLANFAIDTKGVS